MSQHDHPDDGTLTQELRDSLSELAVPGRPPLAAITSRGRLYRRRRLTGLGVTGAAVVIALILGLTGVFRAAPKHGPGTIQTADFTLTSYTNGTVGLTLKQLFDPGALQQALAKAGVPALVKTNTYCASHPAGPNPAATGVLAGVGPGKGKGGPAVPSPGGGVWLSMTLPVKPSQLPPDENPVTWVINPAAIPPGTTLFIGSFPIVQTIFMDLLNAGSYTCNYAQQPPDIP
ncbi:MAG TPA: hypothetical protein VMC83_27340 [Streptosporangiaceae bacterium]|nr:hypothetical protein [Streptosporangiaceae bacterium]